MPLRSTHPLVVDIKRHSLEDGPGMKISQAKRMQDMERENTRLKKAIADLTLDKVILKEALEGNY